MEALTAHIHSRIEEKKHCVIFQKDIEKICHAHFGVDAKTQKSIEAYAKKHGWTAKITDSGLRVTFRVRP